MRRNGVPLCALALVLSFATDLFAAGQQGQPEPDWPNLNAYREANAKLAVPAEGEARVVFFGDSITYGWNRAGRAFFPGKPYIFRGLKGQTTPQMLIRFRQDVVALRPSVVVILAGTNDVAGNTGPSTLEMIEDNLMSMADLAKANRIRVVLASVLPAADYPWRPGVNPAAKIVALNGWITDQGWIPPTLEQLVPAAGQSPPPSSGSTRAVSAAHLRHPDRLVAIP